MSLFLGKIHYWLYNKINWFEDLEKEILKLGKKDKTINHELETSIYDKYGRTLENKPLEEIIDKDNIHGWLQDKISKAEIREAIFVSEILNKKPKMKEELCRVFREQGEKAARNYKINNSNIDTPEKAYNALNDYILDGMPCDRINQIISKDENKIVWEQTTCIHKKYWDEADGSVKNFYDLRDCWITCFIKTLNSELIYTSTDFKKEIIKK